MEDATRTADSIALEAEYWKQVLTLCGELNESIGEGANELVRVQTATLDLLAAGNWPAACLALGEGLTAAMSRLRTLQRKSGAIGDLAGGRVVPLFAEAGLEPPAAEQ